MFNAIEKLAKRFNVRIIYLFGSRKDEGTGYLKGHPVSSKVKSDLDIGVVFGGLPPNKTEVYGQMYIELSEIFEPFEIDLVFLEETDSLFQYEAIKGEVVYYDDMDFLDSYEESVMKRAEDYSFKLKEFERDLLEGIRDGYFEIKS